MQMTARGTHGVKALVYPRNVAIVGASDRPGSWSGRVFRSLTRMGFEGEIYPVNPRNQTVWDGRTCYESLSALPEPPDHVVVLVPGAATIETIREAGTAGARSATIFSSGFGEGGDEEGQKLGAALHAAVAESGLAVSGPNCLGNLAARSNLMTLTDERIDRLQPGPVAIFGQSGGMVTAIYRSLAGRGIQAGYALTAGNEVGLNAADYIRFFAEDEDTRVVVGFVESIKDPAGFRDACLAARDAGKPVVILKIGGSAASRAAALAHTGSLAGSLACFDAIADAIGIIRVDTIDAMIEVVDMVTHGHRPAGSRLGAITFSGGFKGLLLEGAARRAVSFPPLTEQTLDSLREIVGVGTSLGNPLDAGFTALSDRDAYIRCVEILQKDPGLDMLIVQEELPAREGLNAKADNLRLVDQIAAAPGSKPIAVVSMASYMYTDYTRTFRQNFPNLPVLHEIDKALGAIAAAARWSQGREREACEAEPRPVPGRTSALLERARQAQGRHILGEREARALIGEYGIPGPRIGVASNAAAAGEVADAIGYPVVLKLVSPDIQHKTEVGGVRLGLAGRAAVERAFDEIARNLAEARPDARFEGVLVAEQIEHGVELALGIQVDPEVGPVIMFGTGGVHLELYKDVVFGALPLTLARAEEMISATRAGELLDGFRGSPPCDREAVAEALMGLSRLAGDLKGHVESIDLNPIAARPGRAGVVALDALIVLGPEQSR